MAKKKNINNVNNDVSPIMMVSIFIIFIIAMVFVTYFGMNLSSPVSKYFSIYNTKISNNLGELVNKQKEMDNKIKDLSINGGYTIDTPCLLKNPYGLNPLTALVIFNTEEDTRVSVYLNDQEEPSYNVERSKNHIIPIYGLLDNTTNHVKLVLEDGTSKTVDVGIEPLDNDIYDFDVASQIGTNDIYYMVGNVNDSNSKLRGFDRYGNLISHVSLDYIGGFKLFKNKIAIAYNQTKDVDHDLRLDIDYLGRISTISSNTKEINYETNISSEDVGFIGTSYNMFSDLIGNYTFNDLVSNDSYDPYKELSLDEYEVKLQNAEKYTGDFKVSYMNDYIAYKGDVEGELLVVTYSGKLVSYNIENKGIIRTDLDGDKSLYIKVNGTIYSLKTTLMN
jgi:hypothetical protein